MGNPISGATMDRSVTFSMARYAPVTRRTERAYTGFGIRSMPDASTIIHSDPEILGGTPVFVGTRVPVKSLYDHLEGGDALDEFLDSFPSVTREQAVAALSSDAK